MIIVLKPEATKHDKDHLLEKVKSLGLRAMVSEGVERTIIGLIGEEDIVQNLQLEAFPGVEKVMPVLKPFKLVSRDFHPKDTIVKVGGVEIGGKKLAIAAGPCAVENREMLLHIAKEVQHAGAKILRGGAFKPRTSPYAFQGLGREGLKLLADAREKFNMPVVTEVMDPRDVDLVEEYADIIQVGARNMQNFTLLKQVGQAKKPVLLKRGLSSTIKELLLSAEYICSEGNMNVILCERGIRTFEDSTRNTLDVSAVPVIKALSHLPVFLDPSHAAGKWEFVAPLAKASIAAGADGLIIEVHNNPETALSDGPQSMLPKKFAKLMQELDALAKAVGRTL